MHGTSHALSDKPRESLKAPQGRDREDRNSISNILSNSCEYLNKFSTSSSGLADKYL
ncbi:MAG: hypothetical protein ACTSUX_01355 [Promethearchaeota archaeon]